ncbi:nifR3 family TIM-barrel protein [Hypnocyclicus thermotrophus]|uniref:tRNA-dihydrouridine synthase n=1 Tax=Hypnocyclicus thermotrophus TaxID=1627895 RepID=A0AA46DY23_9FUSO|nr:tRNA dihydrouridine synthase DusB [Hypnocyclicus thermotrophus]TDT69221.1 nifR3 family TIM-barrel protein [Hypnocyclicus thermotrophus]
MKKIYVAPIAGVTDFIYRKILNEFQPDLMFTEMVSVNAVQMGNKKTVDVMLKLHENDGVQIFGKDIELMKDTAIFLEEKGVKNIDVNMGCPMPKITKNGYGAALLEDKEHVKKLLTTIKNSLKEETKFSIKIRVGYKDSKDPLFFAKLAEDLNLSHITIHGRTREQMYTGIANWEIIKDIKSKVNIPVIGNGDIFTAEDAMEKINYSNVDGIMLARGIFGNPWLIQQIREKISFGEVKTIPTILDKLNMAIKHVNYAREYIDKPFYYEIRKHLCWYIKGMKNATKLKDEINHIDNYKELLNKLEEFKLLQKED